MHISQRALTAEGTANVKAVLLYLRKRREDEGRDVNGASLWRTSNIIFAAWFHSEIKLMARLGQKSGMN